jgi:hypothetical protein
MPSVPAELVQAIRENVRAFHHTETGAVRYALTGSECDDDCWREVIIIPNISNETIDAVLVGAKGETNE